MKKNLLLLLSFGLIMGQTIFASGHDEYQVASMSRIGFATEVKAEKIPAKKQKLSIYLEDNTKKSSDRLSSVLKQNIGKIEKLSLETEKVDPFLAKSGEKNKDELFKAYATLADQYGSKVEMFQFKIIDDNKTQGELVRLAAMEKLSNEKKMFGTFVIDIPTIDKFTPTLQNKLSTIVKHWATKYKDVAPFPPALFINIRTNKSDVVKAVQKQANDIVRAIIPQKDRTLLFWEVTLIKGVTADDTKQLSSLFMNREAPVTSPYIGKVTLGVDAAEDAVSKKVFDKLKEAEFDLTRKWVKKTSPGLKEVPSLE